MDAKKNTSAFASLVNHSLILKPNQKLNRDDDHEREYSVVELSPSEERVKFRNVRGGVFWCPVDEYVVVEDLGVVRAGK